MTDSIQWVDDEGVGTLSNLKSEPATRFSNWTPYTKPIGPAVVGLGTGRVHRFEFRRDDLVHFEIAAIPGSQLSLCLRLQYHLLNGGIVTLTTTRPLADKFATCSLAPDTEPTIDFSDRQIGEYTFSCDLKAVNAASSDILSPAFIPGLKLWLNADTIGAEDEAFISTWQDSSGNDKHALQENFSRQPRYVLNAFGTKPGVQFDAGTSGSGDYMLTPTIINLATLGSTCFIVAKQHGAQTEHGNILGFPDSTGENASFSRLYGSSNDPDDLFWSSAPAVLGTGITAGFIFAASIASASSFTPYFNSKTAGSSFDPIDAVDRLNRVCLGRDHIGGESGSFGNSSNCTIGQVLVYEGVLSAANRNRVLDFLSAWSSLLLT
jgi:hypothetical protein